MRTKTILVALAATFLLAFAAGTATALRSFSFSETSTSIKFNNFVFSEEGGSALTAEITLNRTLSRAFPKTPGILLGGITGVRIENCRAPLGAACRLRVLLESRNSTACGESARLCPVNWPLFYITFIGTLPHPTAILKVIVFFFLLEVPLLGLACLWSGEVGFNENLEAAGGMRNVEAETRSIPLVTRLSGSCGRSMRFSGTSGAPIPAVTVILI